MGAIFDILQIAGGWRENLCLKIANPPYLELFLESRKERGPLGYPVIAVRYLSALKCHPEMWFELDPSSGTNSFLNPFYWRHDFIPSEQFSRFTNEGEYVCLPEMYRRHVRIATEWDNMLSRQRAIEAFTKGLAEVQ